MSSHTGSTQKFTSQEARDIERHYAQRRKEIQEQAQQAQQAQPTQPAKQAQEAQPKISTPTDNSLSPDFLRIVPCNTTAKFAFSELIERKNAEQLDIHHAQYLVQTGRGSLEKIQALQYKASDETEDEDWTDRSESQEVNLGYFRLNFGCQPLVSTLRWVLGKGSEKKKLNTVSRNVDILLAAPRSTYARKLLPSHAFLSMHPESGVWMIYAAIGSTAAQASEHDGPSSSPKATVWIDGEKVLDEDFRCLTKSQTPFEIQGMQYTVQFALKTLAHAENYRKLRDTILQKHDITPPQCHISGIPLGSDIKIGELAISSLGLGHGTFGSVYEGFSPVSGDLRAIKVWDVKTKEIGDSLRPELTMSEDFGDTTGLVRQYGRENSNGDSTLDVPNYPIKIHLILEKGIAFHQHDWSAYGADQVLLKVRLCHQLLTGLATMHAKGYMHRDITRHSLLRGATPTLSARASRLVRLRESLPGCIEHLYTTRSMGKFAPGDRSGEGQSIRP